MHRPLDASLAPRRPPARFSGGRQARSSGDRPTNPSTNHATDHATNHATDALHQRRGPAGRAIGGRVIGGLAMEAMVAEGCPMGREGP